MEQYSEETLERLVIPGDFISDGTEGYITGHGTYEDKENGHIFASLAGVIHIIDKVICVKPLKTNFKPDLGDVLVGRVVSIENKRWTIDVNSY
jgi:exosome complex component RRP4